MDPSLRRAPGAAGPRRAAPASRWSYGGVPRSRRNQPSASLDARPGSESEIARGRGGTRVMRRSDAPILAACAALALIVGVVVLAIGGGFAAMLAAGILLGLAGIAVVALVFF